MPTQAEQTMLSEMTKARDAIIIREPIPPPEIKLTEMNSTQWRHHLWLVTQPDMIDCPRGIRMRLSACRAMQASRRHTVIALHFDEDEHVRSDFLVCVGCEHYDANLKRTKWSKQNQEGKTARSVEQGKIIRKANLATAIAYRKEVNLIAVDRRSRLQEAYEARKAAKKALKAKRREQLGPLIEKAKAMKAAGKSFATIAKKLSVGKTTVARWFMTPEAAQKDRERYNNQRRARKANAEI